MRTLNWREEEYVSETFDHFDFIEEQKEEVFRRVAETDSYGYKALYSTANRVCAEVENDH